LDFIQKPVNPEHEQGDLLVVVPVVDAELGVNLFLKKKLKAQKI